MISNPTVSDEYDISVTIYKRRPNDNFFERLTELEKGNTLFDNMFPTVSDVSGSIATITLTDCMYCEPTEIKEITLNLDEY